MASFIAALLGGLYMQDVSGDHTGTCSTVGQSLRAVLLGGHVWAGLMFAPAVQRWHAPQECFLKTGMGSMSVGIMLAPAAKEAAQLSDMWR